VRALSARYVERRGEDLASRALEGAAKRAAFALYYAPLHFLAVRAALRALGPELRAGVRRVHDLGCGTAAAGVAVALACEPGATWSGVDRSSWALAEARHTLRAFGVAGRARRADLLRAFPRAGRGDLLCLAWSANELAPPVRDTLLGRLEGALARGAAVLVLEPLASRASPWWPEWSARLAARGAVERRLKEPLERPEWIERLDRASGLDHAEIGVRVLARASAGR
jgi:hypothetical protein